MHVWPLKKGIVFTQNIHCISRALRSLLLYRRAHTTHEMETRSNDWDGKPVSSAIACIHLVGFFLGKILSSFP